jgi:hypothetical protein
MQGTKDTSHDLSSGPSPKNSPPETSKKGNILYRTPKQQQGGLVVPHLPLAILSYIESIKEDRVFVFNTGE